MQKDQQAEMSNKLWDFINNIREERHSEYVNRLRSFEVENTDVWVSTYPKSGTTWVLELVYLIENDCNFNKAKSKLLEERTPFFEHPSVDFDLLKKMESPRIFKTHLPVDILPNNALKDSKIVYVLRNPKDVTISSFEFNRNCTQSKMNQNLQEYIESFKNGKLFYGPWWEHVDGYTSKPNIHVIHYEGLLKNTKDELRLLCKFLGKEMSDEKLDSIQEWCSFDSMKNNPMVNHEWEKDCGVFNPEANFYRKGQAGNWLEHFTITQSKEYDALIKKKLQYKKQLDYGISTADLEKLYATHELNQTRIFINKPIINKS